MLSALAAVLVSATTLPATAKAATYCDEYTLQRTVTGGILGGVFGNIVSDGDGDATALGAIFGGAVGLGMSCESYPTYYRERNYALDREIYGSYHEWDNGRIRVIRSGYYGNLLCREYDSYLAVENEDGDMDEVLVRERACRYADGWRVVNYPVSRFNWGRSYLDVQVVYVPTNRYVWGYNRYYGGYYRGHQYGPSGRDFFYRPGRFVNERHHWGRGRDWGRPGFDRRDTFPRRDFDRRDFDRRDSPRRDFDFPRRGFNEHDGPRRDFDRRGGGQGWGFPPTRNPSPAPMPPQGGGFGPGPGRHNGPGMGFPTPGPSHGPGPGGFGQGGGHRDHDGHRR